ncbi:restriction endonuclease subunit S [Nostoc sp. FACHB-892]|uniref:restriction endonuclease subunit S n=1 Tax=Nostoc sp. FACHB-892 TaxID=2692843 RepID=UPI0016868D2C|nr:restriction endonuclease subunit S [Nostoc sp. FACHB-892]MBD2726693.1 restriction endonuclease subunit S [Nostoc sp. FACHB-892]
MSYVSQVSLGTLLTLERRPVEILPDAQYAEIGIYCFGRGIFHKIPRTGLEVGDKQLFLIQEGDFILQVTFAWEGAVGLASKAEEGMYGSTRFPTFRVNQTLCLPPYLLNYFRTPAGLEQLIKISPGSAGRNRVLSLKRIPEVLVPLPPLEKQWQIVAQIKKLTGKVEEVRSLRQKALEETEAFITSLHLSLADSKIVTLDEILTLDEQQEQVLFGKQYPQVGVKGFGGGLFAKEAIDATQTTYKAFNCLYEGALVLSQVKGWEGAIGICPSYLVGKYVSPEYRTFRCIPGKAIPEYLSALVATPWFWTKLKDLTRGMGGRRERTRPEQFLKMKISMPTVEYQQKAIPIFNQIDKMKRLRVEAMKELNALLPSIWDKAFKGEL